MPALLPLLFLAPSLLSRASAQDPEIPCFAPDGETLADDSYRPCNNLGLSTSRGAASSCCRLNAVPDTREVCDASGLCVQGDIVRRGFCTDSTWEANACVAFCMDDDENGSSNGTVAVTSCNDGSFCCGPSAACCDSPEAFTPRSPSRTTPTPSTVTATTTATSVQIRDQTPLAVWLGMGGAILAVLLASLGAMLFLLSRVRALRRRNGELLGSAAIRGSRAPVLPPTPHVGSMQDFADFKASFADVIARAEREGRGAAAVGGSLRSEAETVVGTGSMASPSGRGERDSIGKAPPIPPRVR